LATFSSAACFSRHSTSASSRLSSDASRHRLSINHSRTLQAFSSAVSGGTTGVEVVLLDTGWGGIVKAEVKRWRYGMTTESTELKTNI
jgi:hypothetical protein